VLAGNLRLDRCLTRPEEVSPPATGARRFGLQTPFDQRLGVFARADQPEVLKCQVTLAPK
jgi:hypothetical protein